MTAQLSPSQQLKLISFFHPQQQKRTIVHFFVLSLDVPKHSLRTINSRHMKQTCTEQRIWFVVLMDVTRVL